jgi:threonine/homoserine/homoserine lactone efflux protein
MEIIEPIWKGVATGILFTLTFGAVFFSLIQASVKRGFKKAMFIASGVVISDAFFIAAAVLGATFVADEMHKYDLQIRGVGFVFLLILGIRSLVKKEKDHRNDNTLTDKRNIIYLMKGVMLNSINPMILISWIGVTTYIQSTSPFSIDQLIFYFVIVLATMFFTMSGICYFAGKLRNVLSSENLHRLNIGSGIVFIIFAIVIIWPVFGLGKF